MAPADQRPVQLPVGDVFTFGEVLVRPSSNGRFQLCHREDDGLATATQRFNGAKDALEIARLDDEGNYRPLKTAPNLRRGWQLEITGEQDLIQALDFFYPGRLAVWAALKTN